MPKQPVKLRFFKPPTKAEKLAADLLLLQIEQLQGCSRLRKGLKVSLTDLSKVSKVAKSLKGQTR